MESLPPSTQILVGDLGSQDDTTAICESLGATVVRLGSVTRDVARNSLARHASHAVKLLVEPWEVLAKGNLSQLQPPCYASILQGHLLTKELRIWSEGTFVNPVYERLDVETTTESDIILYAVGNRNYADDLALLDIWKATKPTSPYPYYYESCIRLSQREYDKFYPLADHYLFLDPKPTIASIMTRYHYAIATLIHRRQVRPTLQNLNLCLCAQPLMAEFWCLMADVYYHLLKSFDVAQCFYENAIFLGSRRLKTDKWPMDIAKYGQYPRTMIESCQNILNHTAVYQISRL